MAQPVYRMSDYAAKARQAVAEGIVLLRNEDGVLPLTGHCSVALFGRSQFNYYKSGTGSGGMVNTAYVTGILDALEADPEIAVNQDLKHCYEAWLEDHPFDPGQGWAREPWFQEEMPLTDPMVQAARAATDTAIVVIGRTAGEDKDNKAEAGSYLLTTEEERMLTMVCAAFPRSIVLLNTGNIIDMKWVEVFRPKAVMYVWQGGQEGGNGVLDVLKGTVSPSGKLPDTIARDIADYPSAKNFGSADANRYEEGIYVGYRHFETYAPERVLYPFGFGLSYTSFALTPEHFACDNKTGLTYNGEALGLQVNVRNTGAVPGKEVVQLYSEAPPGKLGKPARTLCSFTKTRCLAPGESQLLTLTVPGYALASYDDSGVTGHRSCFVLEKGCYRFHVGSDVRQTVPAGEFSLSQTLVLRQCEAVLIDPGERRSQRLPEDMPYTGDQGFKLRDVGENRTGMADFLAQLSNEELACLVRGEGMCSPKVTPGVAGAFGGVTDALLAYGIPLACCADGPSGIRMDCGTLAFAMPGGVCLASSFNEALMEELYEWEALELRRNKIDALLGPGVNLHRSPLNGRNFEYFSEDPLLSGRLAAAQLRGLHRHQVTGVIKHFVANNQEFARHSADSIVSERTLRELYLRSFEIAVMEGGARSIMTAYNPVNGIWTASHYDLLTTILRTEWGFTGVVMTDWWAKANDGPGLPADKTNAAAMLRAQNDLYMVTADALSNANGDNTLEALTTGALTRGECLRSAANICRFLLTTPAYRRMCSGEDALDKALEAFTFPGEEPITRIVNATLDAGGVVPGDALDTGKGGVNLLQVLAQNLGSYSLSITCRAAEGIPELAQLSVAVIHDKQVVETISINGSDKDWQTQTIPKMPQIHQHGFYLKLRFAQGGMEVKDCRLTMTEAMSDA